MSSRSKRGPSGRQSRGQALAVAIGGAGIVLAAPAAALLVAPAGVAHAAPAAPSAEVCGVPSLVNASLAPNLADPLGFANPFLDIAGAIPGLNIFIGNGADGTAAHPDGFNGGFFAGSGGD